MGNLICFFDPGTTLDLMPKEAKQYINRPQRGLDGIIRKGNPTIDIPNPKPEMGNVLPLHIPEKPKDRCYRLNDYDLWEFIQEEPRRYPRFLFDHENGGVYGVQLDYGLVGKLNMYFLEMVHKWEWPIAKEYQDNIKTITNLKINF